MKTRIESLLPLLKWAGGKRKIAPKIAAIYDNHRHRRLVEPFCGGLSIALHLRPEEALLNDINYHLINFYKVIQDCDFEFEGENSPEYYYTTRDRLNIRKIDDPLQNYCYQDAQDFYYLNLAGFNGLCRYNHKGKFNTPYGKRKKLAVCEDFSLYQDAMWNWNFQNVSYSDLFIDSKSDFIVADPPYDAGFVGYSGNDFGWQQQLELIDWLNSQQCPIIAHNLATERIINLYIASEFRIEYIEVARSINCDGAGRQKVIEMFATKNI